MKKIRRIAALLILFSLCLSLCGCSTLDKLREARATVTAEGLIKLPDGTEYKLLPTCEELSPEWDYVNSVYVAEEDVPLLLIASFGNQFSKSTDGKFLRSDSSDREGYYCRTDVYDSILERINSGFTPEVYGYSYYDYQMEATALYELTAQEIAAVEQVYTTQEPEKLPAAATLRCDYKVDLWQYSGDHLFCQDMVDICVVDGEYFLVTNDKMLYTVPQDMTLIFANIMLKRMMNLSYYQE